MNNAQRLVTLSHIIHHHSKGVHIQHLGKFKLLKSHFLKNTIRLLTSTTDFNPQHALLLKAITNLL